MTTGQRIQQARKSAGLSQKQLGEKLGLSASMIGQWENDLRNPKYETLQRIAAALDVTWTELVPNEEQNLMIIDNLIGNINDDGMRPLADAVSDLAFRAGEAEGKYKALKDSLDPEIFRINALLCRLNSLGKKKAIERIEELTEVPRYQRQNTPRSSPGITKPHSSSGEDEPR